MIRFEASAELVLGELLMETPISGGSWLNAA